MPVPMPEVFVVKKGWNTRSWRSRGMPVPVSSISSRGPHPSSSGRGGRARIVTDPPSGMASRALLTRFTRICSSMPRVPRKGMGPGMASRCRVWPGDSSSSNRGWRAWSSLDRSSSWGGRGSCRPMAIRRLLMDATVWVASRTRTMSFLVGRRP